MSKTGLGTNTANICYAFKNIRSTVKTEVHRGENSLSARRAQCFGYLLVCLIEGMESVN